MNVKRGKPTAEKESRLRELGSGFFAHRWRQRARLRGGTFTPGDTFTVQRFQRHRAHQKPRRAPHCKPWPWFTRTPIHTRDGCGTWRTIKERPNWPCQQITLLLLHENPRECLVFHDSRSIRLRAQNYSRSVTKLIHHLTIRHVHRETYIPGLILHRSPPGSCTCTEERKQKPN